MSDTRPPMIAGPMPRALRPRSNEGSTRGPAGAAFAVDDSRARPWAGWARTGPATPGPRTIEISRRIRGRIAADSNTGPCRYTWSFRTHEGRQSTGGGGTNDGDAGSHPGGAGGDRRGPRPGGPPEDAGARGEGPQVPHPGLHPGPQVAPEQRALHRQLRRDGHHQG